ncbi:single-stranded-DNA-specific exonuclease [Devosia subaequoris]|uniref:Single-stranded-DNA-specific exonuclease RecJ n=1 Tax=Devosia subaequoris TaxID=395930 RepID=A0A7W6IJD9_9HYPH|nr:single-stranded-DNA-specific exonuclease RecJ [Devosia subaequoris]MBB4050748.1 single-stranded-DNA-specific exonuclease [Devosia subaequoris]MCP1208572.1 single-stranded-DNA-specific exonuclease RecJ [Devosia subaequoris]
MPETPRPFLDITQSVTGRAWVDRLDTGAARNATAIGQRTGIPDILARIMAGRGVSLEAAESYLEPTIRALMPDPSTMTGMDDLAERLARAITDNESVALFGDYDVDGACSCALMARFLRHFGIEPQVHIPDRIFEGYGPNSAAMDKLIDAGASLIITLDCGTTSEGPIAHAREKGADVLVIDHHLVDHDLPPANALVNPNRPDDISGLGYLCAAGVTFMVLVAVNRTLRNRGDTGLPDLLGLLDLVALATICDVVPLTGLNRAFVVRGLEVARRGEKPGLSALALAARASGPLNPYHLGFLIGPRINAGGRIGDAALGTRLLALDDEHQAMVIAAQLDELNGERQRIEVEAVEQAAATAEAEIGSGEGPPVLVLASADWHPGVVGLIAARLRERFERPSFAIALNPDGTGTGSGRSMPGVDLGSAVIAAVEAGIIPKGGGHAMAAGVSLRPGDLGSFRAFLAERLSASVGVARAASALKVDAALTARGANIDLLRNLERAGPYGAGNPSPVFAFPAHRARFPQIVGKGGHISFSLASDDGAKLKAIAFRAAGTALGDTLMRDGDGPLHFVGGLSVDHYQGREQPQFRLIDIARLPR